MSSPCSRPRARCSRCSRRRSANSTAPMANKDHEMSPCPSLDLLRQLLAEQLNERDEASLTAHLEDCEPCQQVLEQMTDCRGTVRIAPPVRAPSLNDVGAEACAFFARLKECDPARATNSEPTGPRPPAPGAGGRHVPGYELLELLGQGSSGSVYKARDLRLNRFVALKLFAASPSAEARQRARIQKEAEAAARLQHPHIVQIHEIGESAGELYLALEL